MKLEAILKERGISKLQLAMGSGVNPSDLYSAMSGKKPFYPTWRHRISNYLGVAEIDLLTDGGENNVSATNEN